MTPRLKWYCVHNWSQVLCWVWFLVLVTTTTSSKNGCITMPMHLINLVYQKSNACRFFECLWRINRFRSMGTWRHQFVWAINRYFSGLMSCGIKLSHVLHNSRLSQITHHRIELPFKAESFRPWIIPWWALKMISLPVPHLDLRLVLSRSRLLFVWQDLTTWRSFIWLHRSVFTNDEAARIRVRLLHLGFSFPDCCGFGSLGGGGGGFSWSEGKFGRGVESRS